MLGAMLIATVVGGCASSTTTAPHEITVVDREGLRTALDTARGEVVVLNFWATWCAPCVEELPHFAQLAQAYGDQGVRVVTVSFDDPDDLESRVRPFVEERDYPFTYLLKAQTNGDEYEQFINSVDPNWLGNVPATFIYDVSGEMKAAAHNPVTYAELESAVKPLLQGSTKASHPSAPKVETASLR